MSALFKASRKTPTVPARLLDLVVFLNPSFSVASVSWDATISRRAHVRLMWFPTHVTRDRLRSRNDALVVHFDEIIIAERNIEFGNSKIKLYTYHS